jgi:hypothetical protein
VLYRRVQLRINQFNSGVPTEQIVESWEDGVESSVAGHSQYRNGVITEVEVSALLRFFTRKLLVKTLQRNWHC